MNNQKNTDIGENISNLDSSSEMYSSFSSRNSTLPNRVPLANCNRNLKNLDSCCEIDKLDPKNKDENNQELTVGDKPKGNAAAKLKCICYRESNAYECGRCHHYFYGRLCEICPIHNGEIFLMDFQRCPYCAAPTDQIVIAKRTWEEICKIEQAELPGGDEGL